MLFKAFVPFLFDGGRDEGECISVERKQRAALMSA